MSDNGLTPNTDVDDPVEVLISAIEHYSYCPRQCGLIHVEQSYADNRFTVRGDYAHERVDSGEVVAASDVTVRRSIPLWSETYGLRGKSDVVEFRPDGPYPIEYKVGGRRRDEHADLQLCAQALCLEEMLGVHVHHGAIYHHDLRRRVEVAFDDQLRNQTVTVVEAIRSMLQAQQLPEAVNDARCRNCSLLDICLPDVVTSPNRILGLHVALYQIADVRDVDDW
ncbi:MAG: CRISPR-associated protein Cas4 [Anaerolinea sp.]|nr:CRISPR-associated protein Cas4 [Anaerolinea sp.]